MAAEHRDRQIAKAHVLGEHGQQRFDDARTKAVADHHAVDVAGVERARRALDAERADHADALADGDRERGIGAAAADQKNDRVIERIAKHGAVQRAHAEHRGQAAHDAFGRRCRCNRQRVRRHQRMVVAAAGDNRRKDAAAALAQIRQCAGKGEGGTLVGTDIRQHDRFGIDRRQRIRRVGPAGFDNRESARCA
jgi:hypothetical protein